jgi:hypothetical protein
MTSSVEIGLVLSVVTESKESHASEVVSPSFEPLIRHTAAIDFDNKQTT